ncbi:MAG: hypothetical protein FWG12_02090 [Holophagaceae bacterium]|nr:hypothetical protein [Holophagaceae bacterium]
MLIRRVAIGSFLCGLLSMASSLIRIAHFALRQTGGTTTLPTTVVGRVLHWLFFDPKAYAAILIAIVGLCLAMASKRLLAIRFQPYWFAQAGLITNNIFLMACFISVSNFIANRVIDQYYFLGMCAVALPLCVWSLWPDRQKYLTEAGEEIAVLSIILGGAVIFSILQSFVGAGGLSIEGYRSGSYFVYALFINVAKSPRGVCLIVFASLGLVLALLNRKKLSIVGHEYGKAKIGIAINSIAMIVILVVAGMAPWSRDFFGYKPSHTLIVITLVARQLSLFVLSLLVPVVVFWVKNLIDKDKNGALEAETTTWPHWMALASKMIGFGSFLLISTGLLFAAKAGQHGTGFEPMANFIVTLSYFSSGSAIQALLGLGLGITSRKKLPLPQKWRATYGILLNTIAFWFGLLAALPGLGLLLATTRHMFK